jgi:hypothetical protein
MQPSETNQVRGRPAVCSRARAAIAGLLFATGTVVAHHGSSISYDTANQWSTWATVTQFNPSTMARQGWTRRRTLDALAPGTRVRLFLATSRAGGFSGIVMRIANENGEAIAGGFGGPDAVDLDGVPGGLQPSGDAPLPGEDVN